MARWASTDSSKAVPNRTLSRRLKRSELVSSWARAMTEYFAAPRDAGQRLDFWRVPVAACSFRAMCFHRAMSKASLAAVVEHCDRTLRTREIGDYDGAVN